MVDLPDRRGPDMAGPVTRHLEQHEPRVTINLADALQSPPVVTGVTADTRLVLLKMAGHWPCRVWPVAVRQVDHGLLLGCGFRTFAEEASRNAAYVQLDFTGFVRGEVQVHACSPSSSLVLCLEGSSDGSADRQGIGDDAPASAPSAAGFCELPDLAFPPSVPLVRILDTERSAELEEEVPFPDVADSEILRQGAPGQVVVPEWSGPGSSSTSESGEDTFGETAQGRDEGDGQETCEQEGQDGLYEVESIIGRRSNPSKKIVEFLVKWKGYDASHCTWEPRRRLPSDVVGTYEADNGFRYLKRTRYAAEDESNAAVAAVAAERTPRPPSPHCSAEDLAGSRVCVFWKQEGMNFWGTLASSTFTAYTIVYDDGETEEVTLPDEEITLWEGGAADDGHDSSARDYADLVGCRVRVYWRNERSCYWGELHKSSCVAYKIEYDDGDEEEVTLPDPDIQVMPEKHTPTKQPLVTKRACAPDHAPSTPVKHPRTKPTPIYVGQRVRAYWNREKEWSEGFLSHFNAKSGLYTISYDDGSFEEGVPVPHPSIMLLGDD